MDKLFYHCVVNNFGINGIKFGTNKLFGAMLLKLFYLSLHQISISF